MNKRYKEDYFRMTGEYWNIKGFIMTLYRYDLRFLLYLRIKRKGLISKMISNHYSKKYGLEILSSNIGRGLYLGHPHNINVNPQVVIGNNCNLNKGCTLGQENRGRRKGVPVLGDNVWVGTNAVVVGKIVIGNDVLIAPNAYVNFDVPSHSIVIGNPAIIKRYNGNVTKDYINNQIEGENNENFIYY